MRNKGIALIKTAVFVLFFIFLLWLTLVAGTSTAHITTDDSEHTYLVADNIWINLLTAVFFLLVCLLFQKAKSCAFFQSHLLPGSEKSEKLRNILLAVIGAVGVLFVLATQKAPGADQYTIVQCAVAWKNGDYSSFTVPGAYLNMCPNQWGIVFILYLSSFLFGDFNYLAFQLTNVLCLVWFYRSLTKLCDDISAESGMPRIGNGLLVLGLLFFPLILYSNFIYGTIVGLALSAAAFVQVNELRKQFRWRLVISSCLLLFAATIVKQNNMILGMAYVCVLLIYMVEKRGWKLIVPCLGLIAVIFLNGTVAHFLVTSVTGQKEWEDSGIPSIAYATMGLQENSTQYDGWRNNYNWGSYAANGFSNQAEADSARKDLEKRIEEFARDPGYALRFFAGKNASQWNNPDFQCFWVSQIRGTASAAFMSPGWISQIFHLKGMTALSTFLNRLQFIILLGAVLFILFDQQKGFVSLGICFIFIGGFVFHTFWEAKGQFTLPYFVMLFPFSAPGWSRAVNWLNEKISHLRTNGKAAFVIASPPAKWKTVKPAVLLLLFLGGLFIVQSADIPFLKDAIRRDEDTEAYRKYLSESVEYNTIHMKDGYYLLYSAAEENKYLGAAWAEEAGEDIYLTNDALTGEAKYETIVQLSCCSPIEDNTRIYFFDAGKALAVYNNQASEGNKVWAYNINYSNAQKWRIIKADIEGEYYICFRENLALTLDTDSGRLFLSGKTDSANQKWRLEPVN